MKIYDISQEVFGCDVYPGDPEPDKEILSSIKKGDLYNLTAFSMCAHNGTHIDAPYHFLDDGKTIDKLSLDAFIGLAYVAECNGIIDGMAAKAIIKNANDSHPKSAKRILIKGEGTVTLTGAEVFAKEEIILLGTESQTVGPEDGPMVVHKILLSGDIALLEGIRLSEVQEGVYFLSCLPLNLGGADGAPCRAVLMSLD